MRARSWLKERGFQLTERDVSSSAEAQSEYQRLLPGGRAVPVFQIRGRVIVGFREAAILAAAR